MPPKRSQKPRGIHLNTLQRLKIRKREDYYVNETATAENKHALVKEEATGQRNSCVAHPTNTNDTHVPSTAYGKIKINYRPRRQYGPLRKRDINSKID